MKKRLTLTDILVTVIIAVVFGIVYRLWGPVNDSLKLFPLQVNELMYGMWFIAATVAFLIIRKPGVALIAETAAASGEFIVGSQYGLEVLIYGVMQGLGAELVFALFMYKSYSVLTTSLAGAASAGGSFVMDWNRGYMADLVGWNVTLVIVLRTISGILIAGIFAYYLVRALEKTGVTDLVRPTSKKDFDTLDS
ncbi:ECF transporter S component [Alkalihalobacillus sp. FSL R5-0424]